MIKGKSVLAVIPARGGSKGVPEKNLREVGDKPLIAWTIEEAKKSDYIDRLVLSSDDAKIIEVSKQWGCEVPFVRPTDLAQDDTPGVEPVLHALKMLPGYDYVILLQPTSPLRTVNDVDGCLEHCFNLGANSCVSVTNAEKSPFWMYYLENNYRLKPVIEIDNEYTCRQQQPKIYALNGAIYVAKAAWLCNTQTFLREETIAYIMPRERSIDIDNELDLTLVSMLMNQTGLYAEKD